MGLFLKNVKITSGLDKKNMFDLDSVHVTTNDFFYLKPAFSREVVAKEDIKVDMTVFSRATPLLKPAYADVKIVNRAFFVPYRSIYPQFNSMLTESRFEDGNVYSGVPYIKTVTLYDLFFRDSQGFFERPVNSSLLCESGSSSDYDMIIEDAEVWPSGPYYIKFKTLGKQFWSILTSLGYNLPTLVNSSSPIFQVGGINGRLSALPLLSMLRIWSDWYRPTAVETAVSFYTTSSGPKETFHVEHLFAHETWQTLEMSVFQLYAIANWLTMVPYERDYFTSASVQPFGMSTSENISMPAPGTNRTSVVSKSNTYTPYVKMDDPTSTGYQVLQQWSLTALTALSKWMHNNKVAGYRMLDRYLAQYGVKLNDATLERSIYLGNMEQPVQITDVVSTSNTFDATSETGSLIGDYAGKGLSDDRFSIGGHFKYSTNEFGQFIIVSQFIPKVSYYQGIKRELLHFNRFEFYNDKFDGLGYQAIANSEVAVLKDLFDGRFTSDPNGVFGYTDRYAESKQSTIQDVLDGDFRVKRAGANTYKDMHLFREVNTSSMDLASSRSALIASWSAHQFDRIFANQNSIYDHFLTYYTFRVKCWKPMRRLFEDYLPEPGESRVDIHEGGSQF